MKRAISILIALAIGAALSTSATAAGAPKVVLEDPVEDANALNDQGTGDGTFGDFNQAGADASEFADIVAVAFRTDKKNVYAYIETQSTAQPTAGEGFRVRVNPTAGVYCLNFEIFFNGAQNDLTAPVAHLRDACDVGSDPIEAKVAISLFGGYEITVPRKAHEAFKKGSKLTAPQAQTYLWSGSYPTGVAGPYLDTTKAGDDYTIKN